MTDADEAMFKLHGITQPTRLGAWQPSPRQSVHSLFFAAMERSCLCTTTSAPLAVTVLKRCRVYPPVRYRLALVARPPLNGRSVRPLRQGEAKPLLRPPVNKRQEKAISPISRHPSNASCCARTRSSISTSQVNSRSVSCLRAAPGPPGISPRHTAHLSPGLDFLPSDQQTALARAASRPL